MRALELDDDSRDAAGRTRQARGHKVLGTTKGGAREAPPFGR